MKSPTFTRLLATAALLTGAWAAQAATFTDIVIFGDSLSDTGNVALATGQPFPAPYFQNRASDGLIWTDFFTAALGDSALPALAGGSNYAFSGARTTGGNPPGMLQQFGGIWSKPSADSQALYVVVGGGNDMRDARSAFTSMDAAGNTGRQAAADTAAANMKTLLAGLAAKGAKHVLISNLPDLGRTPEAMALGLTAASSDVTNRFNALIPGVERFGDGLGMDVDVLDMAGVANAIYLDAVSNGGRNYGLTNAFTPCKGFTGSTGIACNVSLFSDALHPSSAAHKLIAQAGLMALVPEPETYALMLFGLVAVGFAARRRQA